MTSKTWLFSRPAAQGWKALCATCLLACVLCVGTLAPAHALSEINRQDEPADDSTTLPPGSDGIEKLPLPAPIDPAAPAPDGQAPADEDGLPERQTPAEPAPDSTATEPLPEIEYDTEKLPEPVRKLRDGIMDAAKSGDLEKLRPLIGTGEQQTQLSLGGIEGDPIQFLKSQSGDEEGLEILAILEDVLSAGYVHMKPDAENDFYVWPYFSALPIDRLTPQQRVELFRIVTAGDLEDMKTTGIYNFYRVGITPDGKWSFFLAGD